jgi:hypothetical protein
MKIKGYMKYAIVGLISLASVSGCSSFGKIIETEPISSIPDKNYEVIIRLDTPEGAPLQCDAGFVYVAPGGKVTTDFPREVFVKNLDKLDKYEQLNRNHMGKSVIKDSKGVVRGYYEILFDYRTIIWEKQEGNILLQIIIPKSSSNIGGVGVGVPITGVGGR